MYDPHWEALLSQIPRSVMTSDSASCMQLPNSVPIEFAHKLSIKTNSAMGLRHGTPI